MKVARRSIVAIAGVLLGGALIAAQGPGSMGGNGPGFGQRRPPLESALGPGGNGGRWWNKPDMVTQLKLTDDQRKAMDGILLQHREKLVDLEGSLKKAELEMEPLMQADQPNENQILAQIDKVASARAELEKANARFLLDIRAKLTLDQWKQLQTIHANRMASAPPANGPGSSKGPHSGMQRQWGPGSRGQQASPPPPGPGGTQGPAPAPGTGAAQ